MTVTKKHYSKCSVFVSGFKTCIKTILPCSVAWSVKFCWLLTTFQSDAASAHWRPSLVSDKHVPACPFQLVSPGVGALVWFSCTKALSCCDTRHRTSHQTWPANRPDFSSVDYRLLSYPGMRLPERARDVKHRWWTVVIDRMTYYISQGRVETPIRTGGQLCSSSVAKFNTCVPTIIQIQCGLKSYCKNIRVQFLSHDADRNVCN